MFFCPSRRWDFDCVCTQPLGGLSSRTDGAFCRHQKNSRNFINGLVQTLGYAVLLWFLRIQGFGMNPLGFQQLVQTGKNVLSTVFWADLFDFHACLTFPLLDHIHKLGWELWFVFDDHHLWLGGSRIPESHHELFTGETQRERPRYFWHYNIQETYLTIGASKHLISGTLAPHAVITYHWG